MRCAAETQRSASWAVSLSRLDAEDQRVAQQLGQRAVTLALGGEYLLGEERVALAAGIDALEQLVVGRRAEDSGQLRAELFAAEALDRDPRGCLGALDLGQERAQRMAPVQFVDAEGRDDQQSLAADVARQEREEVARGAVGPVKILDDEQHRRLLGEPLEEP